MDDLSSPSENQKRVVISGVAGMGKTQLALMVAFELRKLFFGVFWIGASSYEHIRAGWAYIAEMSGLEPNHLAGLEYLASLRKPWLLIMDNADQLDALLEDFLPLNDLGCILLTTRNPAFTTRYPVGSPWKSYALTELSEREGAKLLLLAARQKGPHSAADIETASQIAASCAVYPWQCFRQAVTWLLLAVDSKDILSCIGPVLRPSEVVGVDNSPLRQH